MKFRAFFVMVDAYLVYFNGYQTVHYGAERNAWWGLLYSFLTVTFTRITIVDYRKLTRGSDDRKS